MGNTFGNLFRVTTFGESHGVALGCVVDGCPAGILLNTDIIQSFLNRRKPGQSIYTTQRGENDLCEIVSGLESGITLGSPIAILIRNHDKKTNDYNDLANIFRPGHADFTTFAKYGIVAQSGGGRASARETVGRVAAAAVAKSFVQTFYSNLNVVAWVDRIADIQAEVNIETLTQDNVEESLIRCPDKNAASTMQQKILAAKADGDSLGGVVRCIAKHIPKGLGEPVFNKFEAELAKAMLSLPASKSFEMGNGLAATYLCGSENNDFFTKDNDENVVTQTNRCGGIQGGISNGMPIDFCVGFKPVSTIFKMQKTLDKKFDEVEFRPQEGRHDPCVLPRAVPLVEAMFWLVIADFMLKNQAHKFKKF
jgi:chorismate synthase